jgi:ribosomal protein L7/L12
MVTTWICISVGMLSFVGGIALGLNAESIDKALPDPFNFRVKRAYKKSGLISAIKLYRSIHNVGLKEAKEHTEKICKHVGRYSFYKGE